MEVSLPNKRVYGYAKYFYLFMVCSSLKGIIGTFVGSVWLLVISILINFIMIDFN